MRIIDADVLMEAINTWPKFGVDERGRIVPWNEGYEPYIHLRDAVIAITGMPTIEPERKKGKWVRNFDGNEWYWYCLNCKEKWYEEDLLMGGNDFPNYCPNCGSYNGGEQE